MREGTGHNWSCSLPGSVPRDHSWQHWGTLRDTREQTWLSYIQDKLHPHSTLSPAWFLILVVNRELKVLWNLCDVLLLQNSIIQEIIIVQWRNGWWSETPYDFRDCRKALIKFGCGPKTNNQKNRQTENYPMALESLYTKKHKTHNPTIPFEAAVIFCLICKCGSLVKSNGLLYMCWDKLFFRARIFLLMRMSFKRRFFTWESERSQFT